MSIAGSGSDPLEGGFPRCGERDARRANACDGLERIRPFDPHVSALTDGSILIGEFSGAMVWIENGNDMPYDDVCVGFVVDVPEIELTPDGSDMTHPRRTGVYANATHIVNAANFRVGDVQPGTTARFTAYTSFFGTDCVGPTASVDAVVKDW